MHARVSARRASVTLALLVAGAGLLGACAKSEDAATDTAAAGTATTTPAATDTSVAGMKPDSAGAMGDVAMNETAPKDSLQATQPGAQYDKDFYHHVIAHHREGVQMIDKMAPLLTGDVKAMAEKSKADQRREIQEFEKKGGAGGPKG